MSARSVFLLLLTATSLLVLAPARADDRTDRAAAASRFSFELGGVRYGLASVRAAESAERGAALPLLVVSVQEVAPPLVSLVGAFAQGKTVKKDLRLSSGAVVRKANEARLNSIKLPALGSGGAADVELAFATPSMTTQPLLSAKEAPPPPPGARISTFRVEVSGMSAVDAPKLDAITLAQRPDGAVTTGEVAFEAAAGGAPPFTAWHKASAARPAPRTLRLEYVGPDGRAVLQLELERCTPSSVRPLGASGTTRITLTCASVKAT